MSKKANSCVPSDSDSDLSLSDDDDFSSDDDETVLVNGFNVLVSQEDQVKEMFKKQRDLISDFSIKHQQLKDAYMKVLLDLIETLSKPSNDLSLEVLNKADNTLIDLTRAGLKVSWLRQTLDGAYKERIRGARIKEIEEQVKKRKLALSDLEYDLKKEKALVLAAKARVGSK